MKIKKKLLIYFLTSVTATGYFFANAHAVTLNFDDTGNIGTLHEPGEIIITQRYGGLTWNNAGVINPAKYQYDPSWSGYAVLSDNMNDWVLFNRFAEPLTISSSSPWTINEFEGASAWYTGNPDDTLSITGSLNGNTVFEDNLSVFLDHAVLYHGNTHEIDTVTISMNGYIPQQQGWFGINNFSYTPVQTNPVPEPGTLLLMGTGLAAGAWCRKKRRG